MTAIQQPAPAVIAAPRSYRKGNILADWLSSTDHKIIGHLYLITSFGFFVAGGIMAMIMRAQLMAPDNHLVSDQVYNELFTMHGTIMLLLFATPTFVGFANEIMPLQIGSPDVAFPRLNLFSYYLFLFGGLILLFSFIAPGGAAAFGWYAYSPLTSSLYSPGVGADMWIMGLVLAGFGTILGGVNFVTTIFCMRAPGMTMFRMPLFSWSVLVTSMLVLLAFPVLTAALLVLEIDRKLGAQVFSASSGGALLWQHLFWFFGHPEVYIVALPFFGIISEILPVFSRKPLFGYKGMVGALIAIAGLSLTVWAHHMFTTGAVLLPFFSFMTFLIAVPTGLKFFNWLGTMWRGQLTFEPPMLFAIGFLITFLFGGLTGVILASPPLDFAVSDSYFVVAHFHYVLFGTVVFSTFGGFYFWWPKWTGKMLDHTLGKWHFWSVFIGFNLTFLVQHWLGLLGMPRRVANYPFLPHLATTLNDISSIGAFILGASTFIFFYNVYKTWRHGERVTADDPWGFGNSLEWATSCPPPRHNFTSIPRIRSERPAFDLHYPRIRTGRDPHERVAVGARTGDSSE
ncbi:MAG: cytochrome c oxidase subunit I [Streptosporangiaceae bacterium]